MEVDLEKLISEKLSLEAYLILHCLYYSEENYLFRYANNVNKIPTKTFKWLVDQDYITADDDKEFTTDNIHLTNKFKEEILEIEENSLTFDKAFEELKEIYPSKVPDGYGGFRRLHQDPERCSRLYKSLIMKGNKINKELHNLIIQSIKFIVNEKTKSRSLNYMQMLPTFLNQRTWETVQEDVLKKLKQGEIKMQEESGNSNIDAI